MSTPLLRIPALALSATLLAAGGCTIYRPGGSMYSTDTFTYPSTTWEPLTLSLQDRRTGETIWTAEVPVGQEVVVRFFREKYPDNPTLPDAMRWDFKKLGKWYGMLNNVIAVPPADSRLLVTTFRPSPEYPPPAEPLAIAP